MQPKSFKNGCIDNPQLAGRGMVGGGGQRCCVGSSRSDGRSGRFKSPINFIFSKNNRCKKDQTSDLYNNNKWPVTTTIVSLNGTM